MGSGCSTPPPNSGDSGDYYNSEPSNLHHQQPPPGDGVFSSKGGGTLGYYDDPLAEKRPWQIVEKVPLVTVGFPQDDEERDRERSKTRGTVSSSYTRTSTHAVPVEDLSHGTEVYVILDGRWWPGEITRVSRSGGGKLEVRLFGAKKNTPAVVVHLNTARYRLRVAPASFFAEGRALSVLDQFVSKKTKRYKEQWRAATVISPPSADSPSKVLISFDGWSDQHNIWLDTIADSSRLRPAIHHAPYDWGMSYFRGGRVGLNNMGNTCYMNVAVQCLAHLRPLALFFLTGDYKRDLNTERSPTKGKIASAFAQVVSMLWYGKDEHSASPSVLKKAMATINRDFAGYRQHDAQEFLVFLLDALHEDLNRVRTPPPYEEMDQRDDEAVSQFANRCWEYDKSRSNSYIKDLFCGQLHSTITCQECSFVSTTFDPFWNLSVPITRQRHVTVESCIGKFSSTEELREDDMYYCSRCKAHRVCHKTMRLWRSPRVLVLHLRRFAQRGARYQKSNAEIDFPITRLDIAPFWRGGSPGSTEHVRQGGQISERGRPMLYNLAAFASHIGVANDGHYTATCQCPVVSDSNFIEQQWVHFNDDLVEPCDSINKKKAYIMLYVAEQGQDKYAATDGGDHGPGRTLSRTATPNTIADVDRDTLTLSRMSSSSSLQSDGRPSSSGTPSTNRLPRVHPSHNSVAPAPAHPLNRKKTLLI